MKLHYKKTVLSIISFLLIGSNNAFAQEYVIDQKDRTFSSSSLTIKVGDTVKFTNSDPFTHNLYSLNGFDDFDFDLGFAAGGMEVNRVFMDAGFIKIACAVHSDMTMVIDVRK